MALKWSTQLSVSPSAAPTHKKLPGDKILLPPSALQQLLAAAPSVSVPADEARRRPLTTQFDPFNPHTFAAERRARDLATETQQQLPHPLTFRLVNPVNGRLVHAGIREFSAGDGEVVLSPLLRESLGVKDSGEQIETSDGGDGAQRITVHAAQLAKGTYVRLRPLEAGYDVEDWKALLERYLRDNFTTLTVGEELPVSAGRKQTFRFLVDKVQPEDDNAICIVDTDLEVDIEPLDEDQARESLRRQLEKSAVPAGAKGGSSVGGKISQGEEIDGQVLPGEYVDYEVREWESGRTLDIELDAETDTLVDVFVSPYSSRHRSKPRNDEHVFGDLSNKFPKSIRLQPSNVELQGAEALYISVHQSALDREDGTDGTDEAGEASAFRLRFTTVETPQGEPSPNEEEMHDSDDVQCKNCHQWVPQRTLFLHENFCFRNNVSCPQCGGVFQRRSPEWENHWHCPHDDAYGNDPPSQRKHDIVFHTPHECSGCEFQASNLPQLAHHRTTTCPAKPILCQFCHLEVPQKGENDPEILDPEVLLSGLTPHEVVDGGHTTECHLCNKIIRLRDMNTHLRHHDLDRMSRPPPRICINPNCSRTLDGGGGTGRKPGSTMNDSLGLCTVCFGPLYADLYDPEGKALRRRIERRYLSQLLTGCGKPWCRNKYCKTGRANLASSDTASESPPPLAPKDALAVARPLIDSVAVQPDTANTAPLYFCTDESTQRRVALADMLCAEEHGQYEREWCVGAVEVAAGDAEKAREWLRNWAPKKGER